MGQYVNNGKVTLGEEYDYDDAVREIADLLAVAPRSDGMHRLADICQAGSINPWAKYKPFSSAEWNFPSDEARNNARENEGYDLNIPSHFLSDFVNDTISSNDDSRRFYLRFANIIINRLYDFDGYNHFAPPPVSVSMEITQKAVYHNIKVSLSLTVYTDATNPEGIHMTDLSYIPYGETSPVLLSQWSPAVLCKVGGVTYIWRTSGFLISNTWELEFPMAEFALKGEKISVEACLVYSRNIPSGYTMAYDERVYLPGSGPLPDNMEDDFWLIPLNFSTNYEAEASATLPTMVLSTYGLNITSSYASGKITISECYLTRTATTMPESGIQVKIEICVMRNDAEIEKLDTHSAFVEGWIGTGGSSFNTTWRSTNDLLLGNTYTYTPSSLVTGDIIVAKVYHKNSSDYFQPDIVKTLATI